MESWRKVFREGFAPQLSTRALTALRNGLAENDSSIIQGLTTKPPPTLHMSDWPVECACPIGYCGWAGEGLNTIGEVEEFFCKMCYEADQRLGEPAGCRYLLNWIDDTHRHIVFTQLLEEVDWLLKQRAEMGMGQKATA